MIKEIMKHPDMQHKASLSVQKDGYSCWSVSPIADGYYTFYSAEQVALAVRIALEKAAVVGGRAAEKTLYSDGLNVAEAIRAMAQSITVEQPKT